MIREDRELLAELARLNTDLPSLTLRIMDWPASARPAAASSPRPSPHMRPAPVRSRVPAIWAALDEQTVPRPGISDTATAMKVQDRI
jgi:hypothetical protein